MGKLSVDQVKESAKALPQWQLKGDSLQRTFEFKDFKGAMKFVNSVADAAEQANHHPDIDIRWNKVLLKLSTHSEGGLTDKDFKLAGKISQLGVA